MSNYASHSIPVIPTGPDAPGINPIADIPDVAKPAPVAPTRPEHIPEKFWDAEKGQVRTEELAKSYTELEKNRSKEPPKEIKPEAKPEEAPKEEAPQELPRQFEKFSSEFAEKGQLSDESYQELATKHGLSKDYVDLYIAGLQARQSDYTKSVTEAAGGEEQLKSLFEWAGKALSPDELDAANTALASGNKAQAALTIRGLAAQYQAETGREPNLIGGGTPEAGIKAFGSTKEVVAAMSDKRYANDPAYRKEIEERLKISNVI